MKNAHLVHVLPPGWSPDSGAESHRGGKRASLSYLSPLALAGPSRSASYIKAPARGTGGTCKPKLVQSIEQFLLSFAYPLGSLVSGSDLNSGSCAGLSSPSSNLNQRPKSALILSPAYEKEHAPPRAFTLPTPSLSTSNLTNINTPLKPVPFLLAPGVFASCASKSNVRSRCSLPEEVLEQNHDQDNRDDAYYMDTHSDPETTALTIGEIILLGALDFDHTRPGTGPGNGRAWIGDVSDVVIAGGSPDLGLSSGKVGMGKEKGCEVAVVNTEMMKTTKKNLNGLLTPPESLSSNNSTESVEEEEEGINRTGHTQKYAGPIPPALSTCSPPTHLDDHGNRNSTLDVRSNLSKRMSFASSISTPPPTPASTILKSKQTNNTLDKVKDKNSNRFSDSLSFLSPSPLPSKPPVQLPPIVVHCDTHPPHGSGDSYDLGVGHGVPVLPMTVSIKSGSRTASGSGMGSAIIPLQMQEDDACRSAYGKMQSPKKGSERKGFVASALRKIGLWNKW